MSESTPAPEVSVLIVGYNSADLIGDCLRSIGPASPRTSLEILLVDNSDGSTEDLVQREFPEVIVVPSKGNVGFAGGNNLLAEQAKGENLLLLNPDMALEPNAIDALMAGARAHPQAAAWGGVTTRADGKPDSGNAIAIPSILEFVSVALGKSLVGSRPIAGVDADAEVDVLSGGFVMFKRSAWDEVGGLDERFFLYCEEVDLFYRLARKGHTFWRIAASRGHHKVGHGQGKSPMRLLYRAAGTMEFVRQHWSGPKRTLAALLLWLGAVERYAAGLLLSWLKPNLKDMKEGYSLVALKPSLWRHGYDPRRGLLVSLRQKNEGQA